MHHKHTNGMQMAQKLEKQSEDSPQDDLSKAIKKN